MYTHSEDQVYLKGLTVNMLYRTLGNVTEIDLSEKSSAVRFKYRKKTYRVILSNIHHYFVEECEKSSLSISKSAKNLNKKFDADLNKKNLLNKNKKQRR
jgi:hypothetical protein